MAITVRQATSEDDPYIEWLGESTALSSVSPLRAVSQADAARSFRTLRGFCRSRPGTVVLMVESEGERAGFLILLTDVPDEVSRLDQAFIAYMAVAPQARHGGLGRALLQAAAAEADRLDLPHVSLMVTSENVQARALYASDGFLQERMLLTKSVPARRDG